MAFCGLEKTRYVNVLVVACRDMKNLPGEFRIHTEEEGMQQWRNLDSGKETDAEKVSLSRHQPWEEEVGRTGSGNHRWVLLHHHPQRSLVKTWLGSADDLAADWKTSFLLYLVVVAVAP